MNRKTFLKAVCVAFSVAILSSCGSSKKVAKGYSREQEINEKIAECAEQGKTIHGSSRTLRGKLNEHFDTKDANPDWFELTGTSTGCRSITVCRASALNAVAGEYASQVGQAVKGMTLREMANDEGAATPEEVNKFMNSFQTSYTAKIKGNLKESYALIKSLGNGLNEYEIHYWVNPNAAQNQAISALQDAKEETKLRGEWAERVREGINKGEIDFEECANQ